MKNKKRKERTKKKTLLAMNALIPLVNSISFLDSLLSDFSYAKRTHTHIFKDKTHS